MFSGGAGEICAPPVSAGPVSGGSELQVVLGTQGTRSIRDRVKHLASQWPCGGRSSDIRQSELTTSQSGE